MHYRQLGSSGVRVSEVGLGTDQFGPRVGEAAVREILAAAADAGINLLDTADVYGQGLSEEYIGAALRGQRHAFVIATKGGQRMGPGTNETGSSRVHLMKALEDSLRRLNTDYVDLYQIHLYDSHTPMQELMRTLDEMVSSGKVRYVGASNFAAWQLCRCNDIAEMHGWEPFITIQPHYHLLEREVEAEILPYCRAFGVGVLPYFPLAAGLLTGRYTLEGDPPADTRAAANEGARRYIDRYRTPENWRIIEQLAAFAKSRDYTLTELAIAWLLAEPLVSSVIAGVSRVAHVLANARAARWRLSAEELTEVGGILEGRAA
ncbi:MAG: aldo/keto reductase [Chloroflexi bacterium]|nr:aldo/keto reductase [Chloroflexota bacterium]